VTGIATRDSAETGEPLADVLSRVWRDQGQIGFLLTDPNGDGGEVRHAFDPVSQVRFRFRWLPHRELRTDVAELEARGILDPERDESVLFRDPRDPSGRFCFLCADNIRECNPREELVPIRLAGRDYYAGANFAWISEEHFTVMAAEHVDQEFTDHALQAMLELHARTGGRFRVVYNGAYAGATIPWHLHYQVTSEPFPVEELPPGRDDAYPAALSRFPADDGGSAALAHAVAWQRRNPEHHRVNVLVAGPAGAPTVHVFLRDTRRSHAAAKGLMGGFEVSGDFVYSEPDKRAQFEAASGAQARGLLDEIRPDTA
jgi:hypothetical protein